jgi:hypothetical protein
MERFFDDKIQKVGITKKVSKNRTISLCESMVSNLKVIEETFRGSRLPKYMTKRDSEGSLPIINRSMGDLNMTNMNQLSSTAITKQESEYSHTPLISLNVPVPSFKEEI